MNPFTLDAIKLIFIFFVPGFVSMKVYDLLIPSERRDFSKSLMEAISFSCLNFAITFWLWIFINSNDFQAKNQLLYYLFLILIILVVPIVLPNLYLWIIKMSFFRKRIVNPYLKPWDWVFSKRETYWVIVHQKMVEELEADMTLIRSHHRFQLKNRYILKKFGNSEKMVNLLVR